MPVDWLPLDPIIDATVRHGTTKLPDQFGTWVFFVYSIYRWNRQKRYGAKRDAKDREQDFRLDTLENKQPMEFIKSPNYSKGRLFQKIRLVIVHSMAGNMDPSIRLFQTPDKTSAHYLIDHNGREVQMVDEINTAWHAGNGIVNLRSIGIETAGGRFNDNVTLFGYEGQKVLAKRIAAIHHKYQLGEPSVDTVKGHREVRNTACPTGVDMGRVIQMAQDAYNGRLEVVSEPTLNNLITATLVTFVPPPKTDYFTVNLEPSAVKRQEVVKVHQFLVKLGYLSLRPSEYGYYGKKTQAAVDRFQKANGIFATKNFYGYWFQRTRAIANKLI